MKYLFLFSLLYGCTVSTPKPFEIGEKTLPPRGCIEMRKIDTKADC